MAETPNQLTSFEGLDQQQIIYRINQLPVFKKYGLQLTKYSQLHDFGSISGKRRYTLAGAWVICAINGMSHKFRQLDFEFDSRGFNITVTYKLGLVEQLELPVPVPSGDELAMEKEPNYELALSAINDNFDEPEA